MAVLQSGIKKTEKRRVEGSWQLGLEGKSEASYKTKVRAVDLIGKIQEVGKPELFITIWAIRL